MAPATATNTPPAFRARPAALFALDEELALALALALDAESAVGVPVDDPVLVVAAEAEPVPVAVEAAVEMGVLVVEY